jgi:hypothetical protein
MTLYDCPSCALPATASPRGRAASTHGPVDHVFVRCIAGHWFLGPTDMLLAGDGAAEIDDPAQRRAA